MATEEQLAAFQTAVASGNIQEAANIAASAGYSPQQVAEYVNANAPILGLGPETGFSGVTAANLQTYRVYVWPGTTWTRRCYFWELFRLRKSNSQCARAQLMLASEQRL
jgi:hypothetical protein